MTGQGTQAEGWSALMPAELVRVVEQGFALDIDGMHGRAHWRRVRDNGLRLAGLTGAGVQVVELFALFHDARRQNDYRDPEHGLRGARLAGTLRHLLPALSADEFADLVFACEHHTRGWTEANVTVQTCWDADRLDLARAGIFLVPERLCTPAARDPEIMEWASRRSCGG